MSSVETFKNQIEQARQFIDGARQALGEMRHHGVAHNYVHGGVIDMQLTGMDYTLYCAGIAIEQDMDAYPHRLQEPDAQPTVNETVTVVTVETPEDGKTDAEV